MMRISILAVLCLVIYGVSCRGLNEEFTWTRINYDWGTRRSARSPQNQYSRPTPGRRGSIKFPGNTNHPEGTTERTSSSTPNNNEASGDNDNYIFGMFQFNLIVLIYYCTYLTCDYYFVT